LTGKRFLVWTIIIIGMLIAGAFITVALHDLYYESQYHQCRLEKMQLNKDHEIKGCDVFKNKKWLKLLRSEKFGDIK
jgi:hypothetical protein